jgi:integrase
VREQRPTFVVPKFALPEVDEHQPTILSDGLQTKVLLAIPWPKAGVFYCMAQTLVRPSEARALRVRDWDGEFALRVARAAKDHRTRGVVWGLKPPFVKIGRAVQVLHGGNSMPTSSAGAADPPQTSVNRRRR